MLSMHDSSTSSSSTWSMRKWFKCSLSSLLLPYLLSHSGSPMATPMTTVDRGREDLSLIYRGFCMVYRDHLKEGSWNSPTPVLGHPWRTVVEESSPNGQNFNHCTWLFILLGKRNDQIYDNITVLGFLPIIWLESQELVRHSGSGL